MRERNQPRWFRCRRAVVHGHSVAVAVAVHDHDNVNVNVNVYP